MPVTTRARTSTPRWSGRPRDRRLAAGALAERLPGRRARRKVPALAAGLSLALTLAMASVSVAAGAASAGSGVGLDAPLVDAVRQGDADAARAALDGGADVDARQPDGATALHWAARLDRVDLAQVLLEDLLGQLALDPRQHDRRSVYHQKECL